MSDNKRYLMIDKWSLLFRYFFCFGCVIEHKILHFRIKSLLLLNLNLFHLIVTGLSERCPRKNTLLSVTWPTFGH